MPDAKPTSPFSPGSATPASAKSAAAAPGRTPAKPTTGLPQLMGIMNLTPDSFSDGGTLLSLEQIQARADALVTAGATILDLGAESTRPGATPVTPEDEQRRLLPALRQLLEWMQNRRATVEGFPNEPALSVDTRHAATAEAALNLAQGFERRLIINDISGLRTDPAMPELIASYDADIVITHNRADPQTMTAYTTYQDLVAEVLSELDQVRQRYRSAGVPDDRIILDPGIGFSKTHEQNWDMVRNLDSLVAMGNRVLFSASRKGFLGSAVAEGTQGFGRARGSEDTRGSGGAQVDPPPAAQRDTATAVLSGLAAVAGTWAVRVHEIAPNREAMIIARKAYR